MVLVLKDKYLDILDRLNVAYDKETISIHGYIKDYEGEEVYVNFDYVSTKQDVLYIQAITFEYIAASSLLQAKKEQQPIPKLDKAITFIIDQWKEINFSSVLKHTETTGFVALEGDLYRHFNFHYDDLGDYVTRAFNTFQLVIKELKGEGIVLREKGIQTIALSELSFNKDLFMNYYEKLLNAYFDSFEHHNQQNVIQYEFAGYLEEELDEMRRENEKKEEQMQAGIQVTLDVLKQIIYN